MTKWKIHKYIEKPCLVCFKITRYKKFCSMKCYTVMRNNIYDINHPDKIRKNTIKYFEHIENKKKTKLEQDLKHMGKYCFKCGKYTTNIKFCSRECQRFSLKFPETIEKHRQKVIGQKRTEDTKRKMRGQKRTEGTKQLIREAKLKNNPGAFKKGNIPAHKGTTKENKSRYLILDRKYKNVVSNWNKRDQ